jgi:hypothetical protein
MEPMVERAGMILDYVTATQRLNGLTRLYASMRRTGTDADAHVLFEHIAYSHRSLCFPSPSRRRFSGSF